MKPISRANSGSDDDDVAIPMPTSPPRSNSGDEVDDLKGVSEVAESAESWMKVQTNVNGKAKFYYFNKSTGRTTWKKPKNFELKLDGNEEKDALDIPSPVSNKEGDKNGNMDEEEKGHYEEEDGEQKPDLDDPDAVLEVSAEGKFRLAKHRKGFWNRLFRTGDVVSEDKLLQFKKSMIKKSLLKINRNYDDRAVQCFKNVMSYMGDRQSSKQGYSHAQKLIHNGLISPESLRDEIFLQIVKQCTKNPSIESSFPPSKSMSDYLKNYFTKNVTSADGDIARFARLNVERLAKISSIGARAEPPSSVELKADQKQESTQLEVHLLDGSSKTISVDSFRLCKDVRTGMYLKSGLVYTRIFGIFETGTDGTERLLNDNERVLDIVGSWERKRKGEKKKMQKKGRKNTVLAKSRDSDESDSDVENEEKGKLIDYQIVFKAELLVKTIVRKLGEDDEAMNMLYVQAVYDVINETYPSETRDLANLAALHMHVMYGDYIEDRHTKEKIIEDLPVILPERVLQGTKKKPKEEVYDEWAEKVLNKYARLVGVSFRDAKFHYLELVQSWQYYGAHFFKVEQKLLKDYPMDMLCAVNFEGITLVHPENFKALESFKYGELVTWGVHEKKFVFVTGNLIKQRKMFFRTNFGRQMNRLINDYVEIRNEEEDERGSPLP